ncbi:MAG TPA: hypothetical protein VMT85_23860 [Thermoanaerobaculia bacterium]|nr:hypothetical protein [Thermoanaerobaculia bacterium]
MMETISRSSDSADTDSLRVNDLDGDPSIVERIRAPLADAQPSIWRWRQWLERRGGSPARRVYRGVRR